MEKRRILIADGSAISRGMLKVIFRSRYEILEAQDGGQTMEFIEQYRDKIDLLILALRIPKKDGFEVLAYMKEKKFLRFIPVIIVAASMELDDEVRRMAAVRRRLSDSRLCRRLS